MVREKWVLSSALEPCKRHGPVLGAGLSRFGSSAHCGSSPRVSPYPGGLLGADCGSCRLDQDPQQAEATSAPAPASAGKCSRTFISFSDDETFERFFPKAKPPRLPVREICPVTHKPAVYRDPITDIPYSNIRAFKIIREAYKKYITAHGLPSAAASAALGATAPPGPDPNVRPTRQKIIIKQSVPTT